MARISIRETGHVLCRLGPDIATLTRNETDRSVRKAATVSVRLRERIMLAEKPLCDRFDYQ
jgi:hypothetical protein